MVMVIIAGEKSLRRVFTWRVSDNEGKGVS